MREVTINGKTVTIESGKTPGVIPLGRDKGDLRLLLEAMKDGESAFLPINAKCLQTVTLATAGKALGCRFSYRTEGDGVRIYRLAGQTGNRSANAAAKPKTASDGTAAQRAGTWA